jgi:hypothetical protein
MHGNILYNCLWNTDRSWGTDTEKCMCRHTVPITVIMNSVECTNKVIKYITVRIYVNIYVKLRLSQIQNQGK